jgi:hypothetical protein
LVRENNLEVGSEVEEFTSAQQPTEQPPSLECGVYYYYHVGKTGGTSVLDWQQKIAKMAYDEIKHIDWFYVREYMDGMWKFKLDKMIIPSVRKLASTGNGWISIHQHHRTPGLRMMIPLLQEWRENVEAKGCAFVTAVTIRKPLDWIRSLVTYNEIPDQELASFLSTTVPKTEKSQSRYLLYNFFARYNGTNMPEFHPLETNRKDVPDYLENGPNLNDEEMEEVLFYIRNYFDIVGQTENMDEFFRQSESKTGWHKYTQKKENETTSIHSNKSKKRNFSPEIELAMRRYVERDEYFWKQLFEQDHG